MYSSLTEEQRVCFLCSSISSRPQTAQDISLANVQALLQSLSSRQGCPSTSQSDTEAEEPSTHIHQKSVPINGNPYP